MGKNSSRSKTLGEMLDIAVGNTPPTPKLWDSESDESAEDQKPRR